MVCLHYYLIMVCNYVKERCQTVTTNARLQVCTIYHTTLMQTRVSNPQHCTTAVIGKLNVLINTLKLQQICVHTIEPHTIDNTAKYNWT